jgi:glutathione synthase/RimK-type ligase-like ATP-grasp enzyme
MIAQIRTKNPSAAPLRRSIFVNKRAIVRLGSRTPSRQIYPTQSFVEVNTVESIENSRDKLRMKECFSRYDVKQAEWLTLDQAPITRMADFPYVGKQIIGFKGHGMQLIENDDQLRTFLRTHNNSYFIEKFYNYAREYRIHATSDHSFLSWRKLRRADAEQRWFFNSTNCNWVGEDHELFQRPNNWDELCNAAVMAVRSVGLDIGAVDIRVQSRNNPDYIVCEVNSAPQLGEIGIEHYRREITNIINNK